MTFVNQLFAYTQEYSLADELDSHAWFADSGASHPLKPYIIIYKNQIVM